MIDQLYYTSCPRDKGRDRYDGFQVKASSEGITPEVEARVRQFSERYLWPSTLDSLVRPGRMSADEFARFPVALHCYSVPDGRFGLTRICIRPVQPERAGNFFAHTLVFPPETLADVAFNPFALARSDIFQQEDESDQTVLPILDGLSMVHVPEDNQCWRVVTSSPYVERLASLVDRLSTGDVERPVILVPATLLDAWAVAEAVLLLLPARFRIRVEFSVYEPDPYRVVAARAEQDGRPQLITTSLPAEGGRFHFRADEYEGQFYVFNFAESRFSTLGQPSAYAQRVATDCTGGQHESVNQLHRWLERLRLDGDPKAWDGALNAIDYLDPVLGLGLAEDRTVPESFRERMRGVVAGSETRPGLRTALDALVSICQTSEQAVAGTSVISEMVAIEAPGYGDSDFVTAFSALGSLFARAQNPTQLQEAAAVRLAGVGRDLLLARRAVCLRSGAQALGGAGARLLGQAAENVLGSDWAALRPDRAPLPEADLEALPSILDDGLHSLLSNDESRTSLRVILPEALNFAEKAGCLLAFWNRLQPWLVSEFLDTLPEPEAAELSRRIEAAISGGKCPQAWLDILRWQLRSSLPRDVKSASVPRLAAACRASREPPAAARQVLAEAAAHLDEGDYLSLLEALTGPDGDEVARVATEAYDERVGAVSGDERWKLRRQMAKRGAVNLLAREFVKSLLPWSVERGPDEVDMWVGRILSRYPPANSAVAKRLSVLPVSSAAEDNGALLRTYLTATAAQTDAQSKAARSAVARSLVAATPLGPLPSSLAECLKGVPTDTWLPADSLRLELMHEMASVSELYEQGRDLSFAALLTQRPRLAELLHSVRESEQDHARTWAMEVALQGAGITDVASARMLTEICKPPPRPPEQRLAPGWGELTGPLAKALDRVDLVKHVTALAQFVLWLEIELPRGRPQEGPVFVAELLKRTSKNVRAALWAYLAGRRSDDAWQEFWIRLHGVIEGRLPRLGGETRGGRPGRQTQPAREEQWAPRERVGAKSAAEGQPAVCQRSAPGRGLSHVLRAVWLRLLGITGHRKSTDERC